MQSTATARASGFFVLGGGVTKLSVVGLFGAASCLAITGAARAQQVEEVVVTAQKREERLQDVPVAVTALSARQLDVAGVKSTRELSLVTPGLNFSQNGFLAQPQIRGVGTRGSGAGDESAVPIYIDGIYQSSQQAAFFEFNNVQRIEVLKGPQGTLFGRNAMGGAINVVTQDPTRSFNAKIAASYARFDQRIGDVYLNAPISENLAANVAVHANANSGYVDDLNDYNGDKRARSSSVGVRSKLMWAPSDKVNVIVGANYLTSRDDTAFSGFPVNGNTIGLTVSPNIVVAKRYQTSTSFHPYFTLRQNSEFLKAQVKSSGFDVTFLLSHMYTTDHIKTDSDSSIVDYTVSEFNARQESYISELRLTSNGDGPFKWIVGAFGVTDDSSFGHGASLYLSRATPTGTTSALIADTTTRGYAFFAEGTYTLAEKLSLTGGLRYSYERRGITQYRSVTPYPARTILPLSFYAANKDTFTKVSPHVSLRYEFNDRVNAYVGFSQGFKSGLFNASTIVAAGIKPPVVDPEVLNSIEGGVKTEFTRAVRFNVSAFTYDYKNLQISSRDVTGGTVVQNAAAAKIYGGEAELAWAATDRLNLNAGLALTHTKFTSFPAAAIFTPRADGHGNVASFADESGKKIPRTPTTTFNLTGDYTVPLMNGDVTLSATYFWTSNYYWDVANIFDNEGSHSNVNVRASWMGGDKKYKITAFVDNLFNDDRPIVRQISTSGTYESNVMPRSFGVKLEYAFN
jgi:iron complex outermembrane receptor protein